MILVHICCSVDSHFFLQKLQKHYPKKRLIGFFYDPNIHPYSEYKLRLLDVQRSCKKLGVELIEGEYDYEGWIEAVRGLETEPERGKRCAVCFDNRLEITAKKAISLGISTITTTLLTSPKKSIEQLRQAAKEIGSRFGVEMLVLDFRKNGGTSEQFLLAKEERLYHQNYCGCLFALKDQRDAQKRLASELMSPIGKQILPNSIESRIQLYENIQAWDDDGQTFRLRREKFLNYRLLSASVRDKNRVLLSYPLFYSYMQRGFTKGRIEYQQDGIGYFNRESIVFIDLEKFNSLASENYSSVKELIYNPPNIQKEIDIRSSFGDGFFTLSPIIVVNTIPICKLEVTIKSTLYEDVRELLAIN